MDKQVTIRCFDTCRYDLVFPDFVLNLPKSTLHRLIKWLFQFCWYEENESTIEFLDRAFPLLFVDMEQGAIPETLAAWKARSVDFQNGYLDPNPRFFPSNLTKKEQRALSAERKKYNARLMQKVKDAKAAHEQAKKNLVRAKEVYEMFQSEKR